MTRFHKTLCTSFAADLRRCLFCGREDIYESEYQRNNCIRVRVDSPAYKRAHDLLSRNGFRVSARIKAGKACQTYEVFQWGHY